MQPTDDQNSWYEGKGLWSGVPTQEWNDWKWQMRNRITKQSDLDGLLSGLQMKSPVFPLL